jgi:5-methylcytosine-specific restriction endonuclease McrA
MCISSVRDGDLRERFESIKKEIVDAAEVYEKMAAAAELHRVPSKRRFKCVSEDELVINYETRMARKGAAGRKIYDHIKMLPPNDRCPFCGHHNVSAVDHILPKRGYALLAINPENLVAICSDCNKAKGDFQPTSARDSFIHPYFEQPDDEEWLCAEVVNTNPPALSFYVQDIRTWSPEFQERMYHQFRMLNLAALYSAQAAVELTDIAMYLQQHFRDAGAEAVRADLDLQARSRRLCRPNSWQAAMYSALLNSDWFCEEGVLLIPSP